MEDLVSIRPKSVAIVVPAFNEESCLDELADRLREVFSGERDYTFAVFLVDNGSWDGTWSVIQRIATTDDRFVGVQLSRNFGTDGGLTAGLDLVTQDAVVLMCADLQDPPELIPAFLRLWEDGVANVYGVVENREGTGFVRRTNSALFYWLAAKLSEIDLPRNASDFRLLDRSVYEVLRRMDERGRYLRGMSAWAGFRSMGVPFDRPPRFAGESKASTKEVMKVASRGVLSNSTRPLRMITSVGLALSSLSIASLVVLAVLWITRGVPFAGFGTLVSLSLLAFGVLALMLGIVSEYVGMIYEEVKARPNFIIKTTTRGAP